MACEERQERVTVFPHELYKRRLHLVKAGSVSPGPIWCTVVVERGEWSRGERASGRSALRRMLASPSSPERARRADGRAHGRTLACESEVGSGAVRIVFTACCQ